MAPLNALFGREPKPIRAVKGQLSRNGKWVFDGKLWVANKPESGQASNL